MMSDTKNNRIKSKLSSSASKIFTSLTHQKDNGGSTANLEVSSSVDDPIIAASRSFACYLTSASIFAGFQDIDDELKEPRSKHLSDDNDRGKIIESLHKSFDTPLNVTFISDYTCWLICDVFLQGRMFITSDFILFCAAMKKDKEHDTLKQGTLAVKNTRIRRKWVVLRESSLCVYSSSKDPYFPDLVIDLNKALRAEIYHGNKLVTPGTTTAWIKVICPKKSYWFQADTLSAARSWVTAIKRQIFQARNGGNQAVVKIPLANIADLQIVDLIGKVSTLRIKVLEDPDTYAIDDYYVMFSSQGESAIKDIQGAMDHYEGKNDALIKKPIMDMTDPEHRPISEGDIPDMIEVEEPDSSQFFSQPLRRSSSMSSWGRVSQAAASGISSLTRSLSLSRSIIHVDTQFEGDPFYLESAVERTKKQERFRQEFSLPEESLLASYRCYIMRGLPVYGRLYLSKLYLCFRSTLPGTNTLMIVPITDIENASKVKGFRFGYSGLVVVIHGHEELFFEFPVIQARDDCESQLLREKDKVKIRRKETEEDKPKERAMEKTDDEDLLSPETDSTVSSTQMKVFESKFNDQIGGDFPIFLEDQQDRQMIMKTIPRLRFTMLTIGSRGDVQPYIALAKALIKDGHSAKIVTHAEFGDWVRSYGIEFATIAGDPADLMALMVNHPTVSYSFVKDAKNKFSTWIDELLETSWTACQGSEVLIESPSCFAGIHIAEALQIPYFRAFTMPWSRTRAYPNAFLVPDQKLGGAYNYMTHVAVETGYWRGVSAQVNRWRENTLHLSKTSVSMMKQNAIPFLYNISPSVFPPSVDFPAWVRVTGYWFLDEGGGSYKPRRELTAFIARARQDGKKLVYVGFGSIVVDHPTELTQVVIEAVRRAGVRCILNKGWSARKEEDKEKTQKDDFPPEIISVGNVPHDWLFPQVDAAVHHGGSGTTGASLRYGVPTVIKPFFGDQKFYGGRVEDLGCGVMIRELNENTLADAITRATTDVRIRERAHAIGRKIQSEDGVHTAVQALYADMDYARSLSVSRHRVSCEEVETPGRTGKHRRNSVKHDESTWVII